MQAKSIRLLFVVLLGSAVLFAQESKPQVAEQPPEAVPSGSCKQSYSGYLEASRNGKAVDKNLTSQEIGEYVKRRLEEGYVLSLYPQISGRLFVIETCPAKN